MILDFKTGLVEEDVLIIDLKEYKYNEIKIINIDYINNFSYIYMINKNYEAQLATGDKELIVNLIQIIGVCKVIEAEEHSKDRIINSYKRVEELLSANYSKRICSKQEISNIFLDNLKLIDNYDLFIEEVEKKVKLKHIKLFALLKTQGLIHYKDNKYYLDNKEIKIKSNILEIREFYEQDGEVIISGIYKTLEEKEDILAIKLDKVKDFKMKKLNGMQTLFGQEAMYKYIFKYKIDIKNIKKLKLNDTNDYILFRGNSHRLRKINKKIKLQSYIFNQYTNTFKSYNFKNVQIEYLKMLFSSRKIKNYILSQYFYIYQKVNKKNVVIITDRIAKADDNGEVLLKYVSKQNDDYIYYFAIDKDSADYKRLKNDYNVVNPKSFKYVKLLLKAKYIYSSHTSFWIRNSQFTRFNIKAVRDFLNFKFIFLQHGVIVNDISKGHNRFKTLADKFVVSSPEEKKHLLEKDYMYFEDEIFLKGLTRFDNLFSQKKENIILYTPTWRSKLLGNMDKKTKLYLYNEEFKDTDYCKNMNSFLQDENLNEILKNSGYKLYYVLHPNMKVQKEDFISSDNVEIKLSDEISYGNLIAKSKMVITDFSSVIFDAMYANIKTIQYFFDEDQIEENHVIIPDGYFQKEGQELIAKFTTIEEVVNEIKKSIKEDFAIDEYYVKNINKFFPKRDNKNSEYIYNNTIGK